MRNKTTRIKSFAERLVAWHATAGRRGLPWQKNVTAYRVWVSEIMLQQTQVPTVIPYYRQFMTRFPSLKALAEARLEEVLACWAGLGYYARARNLHRSARLIRQNHHGRFPKEQTALMQLPGIGRSTAAAILALVHGQRHAILDGNAQRVLARHANITGWPGDAAVRRELWRVAEHYLPTKQIAQYTQAMMDLGATVCTKTRPCCVQCPVASDCHARQIGCVAQRPQPRPPRPRHHRSVVLLMAIYHKQLLLERRPASGIWGGLLSLPEMPSVAQALSWLQRQGGVIETVRRWPPRTHALTHCTMQLVPIEVSLSRRIAKIKENDNFVWQPLSATVTGLPAPIKVLWQQLQRARSTRLSKT